MTTNPAANQQRNKTLSPCPALLPSPATNHQNKKKRCCVPFQVHYPLSLLLSLGYLRSITPHLFSPLPILHIKTHLLPPTSSPGFCVFSICPINSSNALATFSSYLALASVHAHLNFSQSAFPSSGVTCRCSGRRSDLLPTMQMGTESVPYFFFVTSQPNIPHLPSNSRRKRWYSPH